MYRNVIWGILLVTGAVSVVLALLVATPQVAIAVGIGAVASFIAFGAYTSWQMGILRHVRAHLGQRWELGDVVRHVFHTAERANLQLVLDWMQTQAHTLGPFGLSNLAYADEQNDTLSGRTDLVALVQANPEPVAIVWERSPTSLRESMNCASNALYLLRGKSGPFLLLVHGRSQGNSRRAIVHLLANSHEAAQAALDEVLQLTREQSVYRGQIISVERVKGQQSDMTVQFHDVPAVQREGIILPGEVLTVIERNLLSFFRHAEALRATGQGTRHGVLLHGPPGTGKTLVTRYIAQQVSATVLLITGKQYAQLRPTCQLARLLAPSLVILEDVDLIATDRRRNRFTPMLHELLDEMDGLSAGTDIVFLLTTNRPEALEPALAARPGRIDQAIFFPLPDLECRRRLFEEFSAGLDVREMPLDALLVRTEGASPAFLKELFRRATLMAIERGATGKPLPVAAGDFEAALRELLHTGGELTRAFLGFPS